MIPLSRSLILFAACACLAFARAEEPAPAPQAEGPPTVKILMPGDAPEGVRWAAQILQSVVERGSGGTKRGGFTVKVCLGPEEGDGGAGGELAGAQKLPDAPESFAIAPGGADIVVAGRGATGTMYGLLELAVQVQGEAWPPPAMARSPRVKLRADNLFLHVDKEGRVAPWFHEDRFWTRYLDLLARSRFNALDIHGAYCVETTGFSTLTRLFVPNGESGKSSKDAEACAENLARLKWIVERAAARGIRVALMNYGGAGLGRDGEDNGKDENAKALARQARRILEEVPGLWMLGSRCKENGDSAAERFAEAYAEPLRKARGENSARWTYTRSWGTDRDTIDALAKRCGGRLRVEVKYNGEHLGLPYPAIQGWGEDYSYQDFLDKPRKFEVVWQVRAAGTHRLFRWADPAFIRAAVRSFALGGAEGFSLESPLAYSSVYLKDRYREPEGVVGANYLFEAWEPWYVSWGRLAFDPEDRDENLRLASGLDKFEFEVLAAASRIVPKVYAAYCMGVDHRDAAPELEIGFTERGRKGEARSLEELAKIAPLDRARGCSPDEFAQSVAAGQFEARTTPLESGSEFGRQKQLHAMLRLIIGDSPTVALVSPGLLRSAHEADALAKLGESAAARLNALTYFALYRHTQDEAWLSEALKEIRAAKEQWAAYAAKVRLVFLPIDDPLRMGAGFDPEKVLKHFEQIEKGIAAAQKKAKKQGRDAKREPILWGRIGPRRPVFPEPKLESQRRRGTLDVSLALTLADAEMKSETPEALGARLESKKPVLPARVVALVKPLNSEAPWKELKLRRASAGGGQTASFSIALDEPPNGLLLQFVLYDKEGRGTFWPDTEKGMPYLWTSDLPAAKP